jgi:hypothetical protein
MADNSAGTPHIPLAKSGHKRLIIIVGTPYGNRGILLIWRFPVPCSTHRRLQPAILWLSPVVVLLAMQGLGFVRAQGTVPDAQPAPAATPLPNAVPSHGNAATGIAGAGIGEVGSRQFVERDEALGMTGWDHTLAGAFELGEELLRRAATADPLEANSLLPSRKPVAVFSTSGSRSPFSSFIRVSSLNQLSRNGMNVAMKSWLGNFNLTYREIFSGRPNSLGGGVGQASAAAMFTTPRFGSGGKFDFSAAALMGTGSVNTLMGGGFGNSLIGGNGPGHKSQDAPTVAIKLTF